MIKQVSKFLTALFVLLVFAKAGYATYPQSNIDSFYKVVSNKNQPDTILYSAWVQIAVYLSNVNNNGNHDSLNNAIGQMTKYALSSKVDTLIAESYVVLGSFCENNADFNNSLAYYFKALNILERNHHNPGICMTTESMAVVYKQLFKVEETLKYLNIAQQYISLPEVQTTYLPRGIYLNKAEIFMYAGNLDSCFYYIKKADSVLDRTNDLFGYSRINVSYGNYYLKRKNYENAEKYLLEGIKVADSLRMYINLIQAYNSYSLLQLEKNNAALAKAYSLKSLDVHKKYFANQVGTLSIEITKNLSKIYQALNKYDSAYYFSQLNTTYRDSVYSTQRLNEIENLAQLKMVASIEAEQKLKDEAVSNQLQRQKLIRNSLIAGTFLLLIVFVLMINRQRLKRKLEMEKVRSRISRDLHDDIGSTLSSINILSHTARLNMDANNNLKTNEALEKINERSEKLMNNMGDIVWNLKPGNDSMEQVLNRMREYASVMLEAKNISYTIKFPDNVQPIKLSLEAKSNLQLIFKETVNNLVKYSECSLAKIILTVNPKSIFFKVSDNGKGFEKEKLKHINGLNNMQQRAHEIKASLQVLSAPAQGTVVELTIPLFST